MASSAGLSGFADGLGDLAVARHQPLAAIHHEHKEIRLADRAPPTLEHERVQRILARAEHAAGIGQLEARPPATRPAAQSRRAWCPAIGVTIARRVFGEAVEKRRFPDVGTADEDHGGRGFGGNGGFC